MCGRSACGVDPISGLLFLALLWAGISALWNKITGKKTPEKPTQDSQQKRPIDPAIKDLSRRRYEATKLIYGASAYAQTFHRLPDWQRNAHIEKVAEYVDELTEIDDFLARMKAVPADPGSTAENEAQQKRQRKEELLSLVFRKLE